MLTSLILSSQEEEEGPMDPEPPPDLYGEPTDAFCKIELSDTDPNYIPTGRSSLRPHGDPYDGNTTTFTATILSNPIQPQIIHFTLPEADLSREPGFALNAGASADRDYDLGDFYIKPEDNPHLTVMGEFNARTKEPVLSTSIIIRSRDYGGFGWLNASACGDVDDASLIVDENGNGIADAAYHDSCGDAYLDTDEPAGTYKGDGLSCYEEYRGFFVQDIHLRTDPYEMDLAIYRENKAYGTGWVDQHVNPLDVSDNEINSVNCSNSTPGSVNPNTAVKVLNFNHGFAHLVDQHGLWLNVTPQMSYSGLLGIATSDNCAPSGWPGPPRTSGRVDVFTGEIKYFALLQQGRKFRSNGMPQVRDIINKTITHELFHRTSNEHHPDEMIDLAGHAGTQKNIPYIFVWEPPALDYKIPEGNFFTNLFATTQWKSRGTLSQGAYTASCPMIYDLKFISNSIAQGKDWDAPSWVPSPLSPANFNYQHKVRDY